MLPYLAVVVVALGFVLAVYHVVFVTPWVWRLWTAQPVAPDAYAPKLAVILSLRGPDPFLPRCLHGLLQQNYPCYDLFVVVDHADDPVLQQVREIVDDDPRVRIETRRGRRTTCSLKCSSVHQVLQRLDRSYEAVAIVDADTVPHPTYLRELVAPLADERVGCTGGNRWYLPGDADWGTLVRYLWNAFVVVPMYWQGIVWGGACAFRTSLLGSTDLPYRLTVSLSEDSEIRAAVERAGLRFAFVPSLMMTNRETCRLSDLQRWLTRQFFLIQKYTEGMKRQRTVNAYGLLFAAFTIVAPTVTIRAWLIGEDAIVRWTATTVAIVAASMLGWLPIFEAAVRRLRRRRGDAQSWLTARKLLRLFPAVPLTALLIAYTFFAGRKLRIFEWRGIRYRVNGPHQVRIEAYRPYDDRNTAEISATNVSMI